MIREIGKYGCAERGKYEKLDKEPLGRSVVVAFQLKRENDLG